MRLQDAIFKDNNGVDTRVDLFGNRIKKPGINSKRKGASVERSVCVQLAKWTGLEFNRVPASGGLRWANAEGIAGDVVCADRTFPFSVEVKSRQSIHLKPGTDFRKRVAIHKFWEQCVADAKRVNKKPMLIFRQNGMRITDYFVAFDIAYNLPVFAEMFPYTITNLVRVYLLKDIIKHDYTKFI